MAVSDYRCWHYVLALYTVNAYVFAVSLHLHCLVIALPLPCHCIAIALPLQCHCVVNILSSALSLPFDCIVIALPLPCDCPVIALSLSCHCLVNALNCHCLVIALALPCNCIAIALTLHYNPNSPSRWSRRNRLNRPCRSYRAPFSGRHPLATISAVNTVPNRLPAGRRRATRIRRNRWLRGNR